MAENTSSPGTKTEPNPTPPVVTAPAKPIVTQQAAKPTSPDAKPDFKGALAHLEEIEKYISTFEGKPKMNPFQYANKIGLKKLRQRLQAGDANAVAETFKIDKLAQPLYVKPS